MKKFKLLSLCLLLTIMGCSKDDDGNNGGDINKAKLVGSWTAFKEIDHTVGEPDEEYTIPEGCSLIIVFTTTEISTQSDDDCDGNIDSISTSGYTLNGNIITDDDQANYTIQSLTANKLVIRADEDADGYTDIYFNRIN